MTRAPKPTTHRASRLVALAAALLAPTLACGPAVPAETAPTPPPKINVIPKGEVHTAMWELAGAVTELDSHMRYDEQVLQQKVVDNLQSMTGTVARLADSELRDTHPMLANNIDLFRADLQKALDAAKADPPNYYLAGAITGGCVYCHDPSGGLR